MTPSTPHQLIVLSPEQWERTRKLCKTPEQKRREKEAEMNRWLAQQMQQARCPTCGQTVYSHQAISSQLLSGGYFPW